MLYYPASDLSKDSNIYRGVTQLVECLLWEQDAAGSSPVTSTNQSSGFDRKNSKPQGTTLRFL